MQMPTQPKEKDLTIYLHQVLIKTSNKSLNINHQAKKDTKIWKLQEVELAPF